MLPSGNANGARTFVWATTVGSTIGPKPAGSVVHRCHRCAADLDELEPLPAGDVDRAVGDPALRVSVVDRYRSARRVPLDVERDRRRDPVGAAERIGRIVERRRVRLVADRPLLHRRVADVLRPERVRLDEQRIGTHRNVPLGDVQQRLPFGRQARPVPRQPAEQPVTRQQPDRRVGGPRREHPLLDRGAGVRPVVGPRERHVLADYGTRERPQRANHWHRLGRAVPQPAVDHRAVA